MKLSLTLSTDRDLFNPSRPIVTLERTLDPADPSRHLVELVATTALAAGLTAPEPDPSDPDTCEEGERTRLHRRIRELELIAETVAAERNTLTTRIEELATELDAVQGETEVRIREELERPEYTDRGRDVLASQFPIGTVLSDGDGDYRVWCVAIGGKGERVFRYVGDPSERPESRLKVGVDDTAYLNSYTVWKVVRP